MTTGNTEPRDAAELRRQAEAQARSMAPASLSAKSPEEIQRVLHELRVHQIELEMQNEELRRAQGEIEAGRMRYFDLYDLAPVGYCTLSDQGLILEANLTATTLLGTARGALINQPISRFILKKDQDIYYLHRKQIFETGEPQEWELRLVKQEGTFIWAHLTATAAQAEDGAPLCRMVISDITERKRSEEALRASEETYRALVDGLPDTVIRFDREGRHLFVSDNVNYARRCREVMDVEVTQFIGKTHAEMGFPESQCEFWDESIRRVFDSNVPFETEFTVEGKAGAAIFNWRLVPERDAQGAVSSVLSISRDITAHRKVEQEYKVLFREMLDGFALHEIVCDTEGKPVDYRFLAVNPAFERMTGLKSEAIVGRTVLEVLPGTEKQWIETFGKVALSGEPAFFENYAREIEKHFEVTAFNPAPGQFAGIFQDITERKRAEAEREKLQSQLTQAQKMESIGRLAGGVAHDFNNMLAIILGNTELALEQVEPHEPLYADLEEIRKAAQRSADLTGQLLAFARKQTIAPKILDLNDTVQGTLKMLRRLIGENVALAWKPARDLWPTKMDPDQIDQILANLFINARDAIADVGRITVETHNITLDEEFCAQQAGFTPGEYVTLTVSDDGCGMDSNTLSLLFEPFFTTKEMRKGTGLGLATVYGIVKQNNGYINVYSEPGQGATFNIYLPRHAATTDARSQEVPVQAAERGHETILLVEDESALLKMTATMLERQGYTVLAAGTPDAAIYLAREHTDRIDLLLTDVIMPEMNGPDLAKNLVSICPSMKRLFMSGYTADVITHHGVLDEDEHFIQKPFSRKELSAKLREVLEG